jgi:hypothetical protein
MSDQVTPTASISTAADLAKLRDEGRALNPQELEELNTRVQALEEMAKLEDRLKALEKRKRPRSRDPDDRDQQASLQPELLPEHQSSSYRARQPSSLHYSIHPSVELDDSESSSPDIVRHRHKRHRYSKGIRITPSYTLRINSSLREWGDWKRDIERVFEGDPETYQRGAQKILKALDYLEPSLKSLWYTYSEQKGSVRKWLAFLEWTRENIQNGQNATATLYEQLNSAKQLPYQSPIQFNSYLAAIERDLPQQDEAASAMTFYSKLSRELKRQFKTANISIPNTRAQCVAVAQRVWEGLSGPEKKPTLDRKEDSSLIPRPRFGSSRDRKDQYNLSHRKTEYQGERNQDGPRKEATQKPEQKELICYNCNKPGHYANKCPNQQEPDKKAKIQSTTQEYDLPATSQQPSYDSSAEQPRAQSESEDSGDSLN